MNHTIQHTQKYTSNSTDPRSTTPARLRALRLEAFSTYEPLTHGVALPSPLPQATYLLESPTKRRILLQVQECIAQYKARFRYLPDEIYMSRYALSDLAGLMRIIYVLGTSIPLKWSGSEFSAEVTLVGARLTVARLSPPLTGKEYTSYGQRTRTR